MARQRRNQRGASKDTRRQRWPPAGLPATSVLGRHGCSLLVGADYMSPNFHRTTNPPLGLNLIGESCHWLISGRWPDTPLWDQRDSESSSDKGNNAHSCDPGIRHIICPAPSFTAPLSQFQHFDRIGFSPQETSGKGHISRTFILILY